MELKQPLLTQEGFQLMLLIVPYGIETTFLLSEGGSEGTFNRTLWN